MVVTLTTPPPALELISHDIRMLPAPYLDCTATLYDKKSPHNSPFRYETWDFSSKSGIPGGWPQFRENRHVIRDPGCWPQFRDDPGKSGILGRYDVIGILAVDIGVYTSHALAVEAWAARTRKAADDVNSDRPPICSVRSKRNAPKIGSPSADI